MEPELATIIRDLVGSGPHQVTPLASGNNKVLRIAKGDEAYVLKRFLPGQEQAYRREVGLRTCLRRFSTIRFPAIVKTHRADGSRYVLMEAVRGENLADRWRRDPHRVGEELRRLGHLLGRLHQIPVEEAAAFLQREAVLFSEAYFASMQARIAPYLGGPEVEVRLRRCYERVTGAAVEEVVIHADFGPHQVIVTPAGHWVLTDFEFAAIGPFADDLAGTEIRLEQGGFTPVDPFLLGYAGVRGSLTAYEPVRAPFRAYNLLAILTYRLAVKGEQPAPAERRRLAAEVARL